VKRRKFITLIGGATAWPLAARAQQPDRVRRIGMLMFHSQTDREGQARIAVFVDTLQRMGWTDGRKVRIEFRLSTLVGKTGLGPAVESLPSTSTCAPRTPSRARA
jgi:putative ABC transport system substrate-binding protein